MNALSPRARAPFVVAAAAFALLMLVAGRYGVFRDELYYAACGDHLAFGYVDHPPLVALMAKLARTLFGDSLYGLRLLPALCDAATVLLAAEVARALGGARFAQLLAALAVAAAPVFLGTCHFLSMNCVLPVAWTAASLLAHRAVVQGRPRAWLGFGVVCGVALLAKHSTLAYGAAIGVGLLASPQRRVLATRWPWLGLAIAAALLAPNLAWEQAHGWPTLEFMHNAEKYKMVHMSAFAFVRAVATDLLPLSLPLWVGGLAWLLVAKAARPARFLGVAFVALLVVMLLGNGKPYYLAPAFPVLFAAGGVLFEGWLRRPALRVAAASVLVAGGALVAPMALPILSPTAYVRYEAAIGISHAADEKHAMGPLPQHFADQFGWEAMATKVAEAYRGLSPEEQKVAAIYADDYGEAGAIDWFGPRLGLPHAVSGHNAYFMWGPPEGGRGAVLVSVGAKKEDLLETYEDVEVVGETDEPYAMPFENHTPICVSRRPKRSLAAAWPETKDFI